MLKDTKIAALKNEANKAKLKGDYQKAVEYLENVYELDPNDANNAKELGTLYSRLGNKKKAKDYFWKALERYKELEYYENATALAQMLSRFGEDELLVKQELAFLYEKQGLIGDAVLAYEELAELYKKEGDFEGVLESLEHIVNIMPKKIGIRLKLVEIYESKNKYDKALSELEEVKNIYEEQGRVEDVERIESKIKALSSKMGSVKETKILEDKKTVIPEEVKVEFEQEGIGLVVEPEEELVLDESVEPFIESAADLLDMKEEIESVTSISPKEEIEVTVSGWEDWISLAELYESVGAKEEALEYYNKAAEFSFNKGVYEEAYNIYKKIAELEPLSIIFRQKMVQSALKLNDKEKTIEGYFALYECLKKKEAHLEAEKILDKIEKIDPNALRGIREEVSQEVKGKIDFDNLFKEEVKEEIFLEEEGEEKGVPFEVLLEEFKKKAKEELDITDYAAHFNLGITYKEMGLIEEAMEEFKKAMKERTWRLKSLEMLGLCHELLGENEKAKNVYKIVVNTDNFREDEKAAFYYHLGNLYAKEDKYEEALINYKKSVEIDPEFVNAKKKIELISRKMNGEEVEEELAFSLGEELSEEGANLWDSVLSGEVEEVGKKSESIEKKKGGKISYI
ncbi:MAG: tetratricopeptide repeat protein [candidate division WOR-3 bacterium]